MIKSLILLYITCLQPFFLLYPLFLAVGYQNKDNTRPVLLILGSGLSDRGLLPKHTLTTGQRREMGRFTRQHRDIIRTRYKATGNCQNKGNTNITFLNRALDHHKPEQLQCTLVQALQVSGTLLEGCDSIFPQSIPSFGVLLMVVSGAAPESPISVHLG